MTLDREDIAAIAEAVAALLRADGVAGAPPVPSAGTELLTAAQVAQRCGVDRSWVYEHQVELGAVRLGDGPRARLRFDPEAVEAALLACSTGRRSQQASMPVAERNASTRPRRSLGTGVDRVPARVDLLPIRGAER